MTELRRDSDISFDVLDKNRRVQHRATSTMMALPRNSDCELVLAPSDVVLLEVRLPRLRGSKLARALPALVEDKVLSDVEKIHVVATKPAPDGTAVAAVVDRALLRRTLGLFEKLKRRIASVVPAPFALPFQPGRWRVRIVDGAGAARTGSDSGISFANGYDVPVELQLLVSKAVVPPAVIEVDGDCDTDVWKQSLGVAVEQVMPDPYAPPVTLDLLQYEFASGLADWTRWRMTATLVVILVLVMLGGLNLHAWKLRNEEQTLRGTMAAIVKDAIPGVTVILDPMAQMRQRIEQLRTAAGVSNAEFLSVAVDLANIIGVDAVQRLEYADKVLDVEFLDGFVDTEEQRKGIVERASNVGLEMHFSGNHATVRRAGSK
ncbi:MAG: type II secretion system protein GspL [Burkholderiales bacterium]